MNEQELREKIAKEIMDCKDIVEDAKELGSDAYLVAFRTRLACAALIVGKK